MAFDGVMLSAIVAELKRELVGGRIVKVSQPESDELLLTIKNEKTKRLVISAQASLPLCCLTDSNKANPLTAPGFCMLLRKHLSGGRILDITQPGLERIVTFTIGHRDEMGDYREKRLVAELMGKHSNIIFLGEEDIILDSIKHVSNMVSSLREVFPQKPYFLPENLAKANPLEIDFAGFKKLVSASARPIHEAIYLGMAGFSPLLARELCFMAGIDSDMSTKAYAEGAEIERLYRSFERLRETIINGDFTYELYYDGDKPLDFSAYPITMYQEKRKAVYETASELIVAFYEAKAASARISQKSADLRQVVKTALQRSRKKYDLQRSQLRDTEKKDKYRVYGELINVYGYNLEAGTKVFEAVDYNSGEKVTIPLDPTYSPRENAKRYFDKYAKLKRTAEALTGLIAETEATIHYLESVEASLQFASAEEDLAQIKDELINAGFIRFRKSKLKQKSLRGQPMHFETPDGFHIYVGKNNYQNEEITFKIASAQDWWFHAKGLAGSHVTVKSEGRELPDRVFEAAAALAAYYSKGQAMEKVEVDYTQRKHIKKPSGAVPGYVIYHQNYSMVIRPWIPEGVRSCT